MTDSADLRLLAVHAHPDDESSKGAATMAHYRRLGVQVMVATNTGGERGSILEPSLAQEPRLRRDLTGYRREEMARAARVLDVQHRWMGFADSGLPEGDPLPTLPAGSFADLPVEQAAAPLLRLVRAFRPHVILTYDEKGGYPHPDHVQTHRVSRHVWENAGRADVHPELGPPWEPLKLYYDRAFDLARMEALDAWMNGSGQVSAFTDRIARRREQEALGEDSIFALHEITSRVHCPEAFDQREQALRAHATQVPAASFFFAVPVDQQQRLWPWEDFVLAESRVETSLPETSLFAGIAEDLEPAAPTPAES